jgi:hypothetical protein
VSGAARLRRAALVVVLAAVGTGCEYFRDTPEQELANRRWRECAAGLHDVSACLEWAGRDGRPLPEPVSGAAAGK